MSDQPEHDDAFYELVMPFVVCRSNGGIFDDDAYCAGWEAGAIDSALAAARTLAVTQLTLLCRAANRAQLDLLLMKHEYDLLELVETDDGEWINMEVAPR